MAAIPAKLSTPATKQPSAPTPALATKQLLRPKAAWATAATLVAGQAAPAVADVFVSHALLALAQDKAPTRALLGFVAAQGVFYAANPISSYYKSLWLSEATRHFEEQSVAAHMGRPTLWLEQRSSQAQATHRVVNDVPWVVGMLVGLMHEGGTLGITLATQMVVMGALLDRSLLLDFAACCAIGALAGVASSKLSAWRIQVVRNDLGDPHSRYGQQRERMWDNTLLGNKLTFEPWSRGHALAKRAYGAERLTLAGISSGSASLAQIASATVFGMGLLRVGRGMYQRGDQEALAAYFLPITARAVTLLGQAGAVGQWTTQWNHHVRILRRLAGEMTAPARLEPEQIVRASLAKDPNNITITHADGTPLSIDALLQGPPSPGRITVRGVNGGGKTMLATALKERRPEEVLLVPAVHDLMLDGMAVGSSGETARDALSAIAGDIEKYRQITTVVLDETDAALHDATRQQVQQLIDGLARRVQVIEVTHRKALQPKA